MKASRWMAVVLGLVLSALSVWAILAAQDGLQVVRVEGVDPPLTLISPASGDQADRPLVLIGHGFAASRVVMRGFGLTLAHAGYDVAMWDFAGHGANPNPLRSFRSSADLAFDAEAAREAARARGLGASGETAILGHSMGSGVALYYGRAFPESEATIAVSPVLQDVTPELPHDLLLMAGAWEGHFVENARELLARAGGPSQAFEVGEARELVVVPAVEHVSILFSPFAHHAACGWLEAVFGLQPGARPYTDRRVLWYGLGLAGALLASFGLAPLVREPEQSQQERAPFWRRAGALVVGGLAATFLLWGFSLLGLDLSALLGLLVGGYILVWFGLAGMFTLPLLGERLARPAARALLGGLLAFAVLWLAVGALGQLVWLQWLLIPTRLILWVVGSVLLLPWFLALGQAALPSGNLGRGLWWLGYSLFLVATVALALMLLPQLSFLAIILPLFPVVMALHALAAGPYRSPWAFSLSGALFLSWLLAAVFPLS